MFRLTVQFGQRLVVDMSGPLFPIQNFVAKPYAGSLQGINVSLLSRSGVMTNDGQTVQPSHTSRIVNTTIDFLTAQYKGQAVSINLQSTNNTPPLNKILMIYVDNELNSQNVTVAFPDTQQYIGVPAFTTGYYPVMTGQLQAVVYNGSTGTVPITAQSQVSVIFCDFAIPGFLSQETLSVTYNSSTGPTIPVIGDTVQTNTYVDGLNNPQQLLSVINAPQRYVITAIECNATNLFTDGTQVLAPFYLCLLIYDPALPTPVRFFNILMRPEFEGNTFRIICSETGLNIPVQSMQLLVSPQANSPLPPHAPGSIPAWCVITVSLTYAKVTL